MSFFSPHTNVHADCSQPEHRRKSFTIPKIGLFARHEAAPHAERTVAPAMDIRETQSAYFFDIEMPGVADSDLIDIKWTSARTISIHLTEELHRPNLTATWKLLHRCKSLDLGEQAAQPGKARDGVNSNGESESDEEKFDEEQSKVALVQSERTLGRYARVLSFESKVDGRATRAKLVGGLLMVMVPKLLEDELTEEYVIEVE